MEHDLRQNVPVIRVCVSECERKREKEQTNQGKEEEQIHSCLQPKRTFSQSGFVKPILGRVLNVSLTYSTEGEGE